MFGVGRDSRWEALHRTQCWLPVGRSSDAMQSVWIDRIDRLTHTAMLRMGYDARVRHRDLVEMARTKS